MTMPDERTRALRFGWEFLLELQATAELDAAQRSNVDLILTAYPSGKEIKAWAEMQERQPDRFGVVCARLSPEPVNFYACKRECVQEMVRPPVTPSQRARALRLALEFFQSLRSAANLPQAQKRQIPYVLRHFPHGHEIAYWAHCSAKAGAADPGYEIWLAPEESSP